MDSETRALLREIRNSLHELVALQHQLIDALVDDQDAPGIDLDGNRLPATRAELEEL